MFRFFGARSVAMSETLTEPLRLVAQDAEDLAILSAQMQDAVVRVGDMAWLPRARRFALVGCRFDWIAAEAGRRERCHTGLHFDGVLAVHLRGFDQRDPAQTLNLLGIVFNETQAPSGTVDIVFSGGAGVRLEVECLEAQLRDLGSRWKTSRQPGHAPEGTPSEA
jgi:Protein of unknown function (DUF2948)